MEVKTVLRTRFVFHHVTFKVQLAEVSLKDFQKLWDSPSFRKQSLIFLVLGEGIMLVRECGLFCLLDSCYGEVSGLLSLLRQLH